MPESIDDATDHEDCFWLNGVDMNHASAEDAKRADEEAFGYYRSDDAR